MEAIVDMMRDVIEESNIKQMESINYKLNEFKHELKQDKVQLREELKEFNAKLREEVKEERIKTKYNR